ncbi:histidinol-phosphate transaminase [Actinacidiphila soli]|uniref:histidinol-phosphate transaminase n=1 Tax=Actinacidiphila soli TaxID=2487275 RepID=UPI000FCC31DC|nr:histidinol-phosphate transaminase [Actinacidiphila soli]
MTIRPRPAVDQIDPYRAGRRSAQSHGSLASNESPYAASPRIIQAIGAAAHQLNRYPDALAADLRAQLAAMHDVDEDQILVGNGSDELIYLLAWAYLSDGGRALCADPAYRMDEITTHLAGATLLKVPLRNWAHDLERMSEVETDLCYVVNPHNPTGTARTGAEISEFAKSAKAKLVVVDEAYIDFVDDPDATTAIPLAREGRVAVLRTLSKAYGLAGLRVGYIVASAEIIKVLQKIRAPFSVGTLAQAGALAALSDVTHRQRIREHAIQTRQIVHDLFSSAGYSVVPSQANFVLVVAPEDELLERLNDHGISARPGSTLGLPGTVRVSVPSEDGLALLRSALGT